MSKIPSSGAPSPRKYVIVPITIRQLEVTALDELIKNKRYKELYKPSECNRITETTKAIQAYVKSETERLSKIERPIPLTRIKDNGAV